MNRTRKLLKLIYEEDEEERWDSTDIQGLQPNYLITQFSGNLTQIIAPRGCL